MEKEVDKLRKKKDHLKTRIDELEENEMKRDIILKGIKDGDSKETEKNLIKAVIEVANYQSTKICIEPHEISTMHRLPTKVKTNVHLIKEYIEKATDYKYLVRCPIS